jgi:hypothetical protein
MSMEINRRLEEFRKPPVPKLMIIDEEPTQSEMSATPPPIGFKPLPTTSTIIQRRACQDQANVNIII